MESLKSSCKIVTIWERGSKKDNQIQWSHNHISNGFDETEVRPAPKFETQKSWDSGIWRKFKGHLKKGIAYYG